MLQDIEKLLVIQDRDKKIRLLRQELKAAPSLRSDFDANLASSQKGLEAAKLKSKEIEVDRKKLENEAQAKRDQIAKFQTQKFQTRKNEEFAAFNHEIERAEKDVQSIEDRELELMEAAEQTKGVVATAEKLAKETKAKVEAQVADLDSRTQAMQSQLDSLETERGQLASALDEELVDTYQRLFTNKGEAVVALEHEVCTGCHMKVIPSTIAHAKAGKSVVHCDNCGRILYYSET